MTYSLPFGLTQKPVSKKFEHGELRFSVRNSKMYCLIYHTEKKTRDSVIKVLIKTKEQLDYLLNLKEFPVRMNAEMTEVIPL